MVIITIIAQNVKCIRDVTRQIGQLAEITLFRRIPDREFNRCHFHDE